jgi:hypothetical protein
MPIRSVKEMNIRLLVDIQTQQAAGARVVVSLQVFPIN